VEQQLVDALRAERGLMLVLTGAGVSLASGIPTFRGSDPDAIWKRDVMELGTWRYFRDDPVGSWRWYRQRFNAVRGAEPNPGHVAIARLERWQVDRGGDFLLVTQNIDTLHERAGSERMVKVHGSADRCRCSNEACRLSATSSFRSADLDFDRFDREPSLDTIPRCHACGSLVRAHVLWFDEYYGGHVDYQWDRVVDATARMRLALCVGTSFSVGVTELVREAAASSGAPLFIVDPAATPMPGNRVPGNRAARSQRHTIAIQASSETFLPRVCDMLIGTH
jgi:NAD-dependent protein deacetylase/lipoamidase